MLGLLNRKGDSISKFLQGGIESPKEAAHSRGDSTTAATPKPYQFLFMADVAEGVLAFITAVVRSRRAMLLRVVQAALALRRGWGVFGGRGGRGLDFVDIVIIGALQLSRKKNKRK